MELVTNLAQLVRYPHFSEDAATALQYLSKYHMCDPNYLFCVGHSAGGQICTDVNLNAKNYFDSGFDISGFKGVNISHVFPCF